MNINTVNRLLNRQNVFLPRGPHFLLFNFIIVDLSSVNFVVFSPCALLSVYIIAVNITYCLIFCKFNWCKELCCNFL